MSDEMHEAQRRSLEQRRAKAAEEMRQLVDDADHWNRTHPEEEPIVIDTNPEKDVQARLAEQRGERPPLLMFVAHCADIYEAHHIIAENQEAAQVLLGEWRAKQGADLEDEESPDWTWLIMSPEETLTEEDGGEPSGDLVMLVREWIAQRGRGHLCWSEIG